MTVSVACRVTDYAEAVVAGEHVVGELVRLACERHMRDLESGGERGLRWDQERADHALSFFGFCNHYKGEWAGTPIRLEEWQAFIVGSIFGWKRADGSRRFRSAFIEVARKNGKTLLIAGVGLYLGFFDGEGGAEIYAAATKEDQAKLLWMDAKQMVLKNDRLKRRIAVAAKSLYSEETASKFVPLGADSDTLHGLNPHAALIDEIHSHKDRGVIEVLETAMGARRQPLKVQITTAGTESARVWASEHDYAAAVMRGVFDDDETFAYIANLDEGDDPFDPGVWVKANPNLGVSVYEDEFRSAALKAKNQPSTLNGFLRLRLNVRTKVTDMWLDMGVWDSQPPQHSLDELEGRRCLGGLDLSSNTDLSALALWFPDDDDESGDLHVWFWLPRENMEERVRRDRVPYDRWVADGHIELTDGRVIDQSTIRNRINELSRRFDFGSIGYDPWNAEQLASVQLANEDGMTTVKIPQSIARLNEPTRKLEALLMAKKVRHGGHPVLRWMAGNTALYHSPDGLVKPDKKSSADRIDGVVAAIMAVGEGMVDEPTGGWLLR
jgi:phage terminase large subunit-like protein